MKLRQRKRRNLLRRVKNLLVLCVCCVGVVWAVKWLWTDIFANQYTEVEDRYIQTERPDIQVELLTVNPYSRPGTTSKQIKSIVIHYTANPGSTAMQNRNYFEGLSESHLTQASSHFIVGLEGEIVQCVPTWEVAYASNSRNEDSVSIETCHWEEDGEYTKETYQSLVELTAWLCEKFSLTENDVIRHYDITGKICPKYFVEHVDAWEAFQQDVGQILEAHAKGE